MNQTDALGFLGTHHFAHKQHLQRFPRAEQPSHTLSAAPARQDADGHLRRYATDGKGEKHQLIAGVVETRTRWNEGRLVIEINSDRGMTLVESYAVDPDMRQLVVTLETENSRFQGSTRPVRRVYDNILADR